MHVQPRKQAAQGSSRAGSGYGGVQTITVTIIFVILATIAVALRFLARRMKHVQFAVEDYMVLVALVCVNPLFPSAPSSRENEGEK